MRAGVNILIRISTSLVLIGIHLFDVYNGKGVKIESFGQIEHFNVEPISVYISFDDDFVILGSGNRIFIESTYNVGKRWFV